MSCPHYEDAVEYWIYIPQKILLAVHLVLSVTSCLSNVLFLIRYSKQLYFHGNSKILINSIVVTNIIYSSSQAANQFFQLLMFVIATNACDLYISNLVCLLFRLPSWTSITMIMMFNVGISLERLSATYYASTYERKKPYKVIIAITTLLCCVLCVLYIVYTWNLKSYSLYCSYWSSTSLRSFQNFCWLHVFIDIILAAIYFGNLRWNIIASKRTIYDVSTRYQIKENLTVLNIFKPIIALHLVVHAIFCFSLILTGYLVRAVTDENAYRTVMMSLSVYPFYPLLAPIVLFRNLQKSKERRVREIHQIQNPGDHTSNYFRQFNQAWK